jgi:release factor glutamine methyltransferase
MTLQEYRQLVEEALSTAGFENVSQETKWLIAGALEKESFFLTLHPTYTPSPAEADQIQKWLQRRLQGEPLSRLKGVREFWSLPFHLNASTLDPRPDTEVIIEGVLKWVGPRKNDPWRILDLGTGSGCLLIALLHELPSSTGVGIDIKEEALSMARSNAVLNAVQKRAHFQQGNWAEGLQGSFDIIVSNPPYIPLKDKKTLDKGVLLYDPPEALFGGEDGLSCYRILSKEIKPLLSPQGIVVLEIGKGQGKDVERIFQNAGFSVHCILKDLAGIDRALGFKL